MKSAILKPQKANGGGNTGGNGEPPPPPPPPPTLSISITSPANNAQLVGNGPGVSLPVTCSVTVGGLSNTQKTVSMSVYVGMGGQSTPSAATRTSGDPAVNGVSTWTFTGATPVGGSIQVAAKVSFSYEYYTDRWSTHHTTSAASAITVLPSAVSLAFAIPSDGQIFIGTSQGYSISASARASSPVTISSVVWTLYAGMTAAGTPVGTSKNPLTVAADGSWRGTIPVPLGLYSIQLIATDKNGTTQSSIARVQVTLRADVFDTSALSYLQSLVDFGTKPFSIDGHARVLKPGNTDLMLQDIDNTFYQSVAILLDSNYSARANEPVYQARVCVEVLRKYLAANAPTAPQAQALTKAQASYLLSAYLTLLQQVGTSYEELRLARTYNSQDASDLAQLQAIADRLGIEIGGGPDPLTGQLLPTHLDQLCLDAKGTPDIPLSFRLTVTDSASAVSSAVVNITVYGINRPITLSASGNLTVNQGANVALTATASDSTTGASIASYQWTQVSGAPVTLNGANTANASFTVPTVMADSTMVFRVTATDNLGTSATTTVSVVVNGTSRPLTVNAGASCTVNQGSGVTLTGTARDTTAGATITGYQWVQIAGPTVQLVNPNAATASFLAPVVAAPVLPLSEPSLEQIFGLVDSTRDPFSQGPTVGDSQGLIARWNLQGADWNRGTDAEGMAYLTISFILGRASQLYLFKDRGRSVVLASGTAKLPGEVILTPVNNSGVSGRVVIAKTGHDAMLGLSVFPRLLSWQFQRLRNTWLADDFPADTVLTFQLTITDSAGNAASLPVDVYVGHINRLSTTAGPNRTARPGDAVTLTGAATPSVSTATISSYRWTQTGGTPVTLNNPSAAIANFTAPAVPADTQLKFQLTVTDSLGVVSTTTVNVLVYQTDHPIAANAGSGQSVMESTLVTLSGSATDSQANNTLVSYQWIQVAGPPVILNAAETATATFIAPGAAPGPIIDPDVLVRGDFKFVQAAPYSTLYATRLNQVQAWLTILQTSLASAATGLDGLNAMLGYALQGKQLSDLQALNPQLEAGIDISPQLDALGVSLEAFAYLLQLATLVQAGQPLLDSEWTDLESILVQALKVQNSPAWRSQEVAAQLSLSPDYFSLPSLLPALPATGVDPAGFPLAEGTTDPRWTIVSTPSNTSPSPAYVTNSTYPIGIAWAANDENSRWISPQANEGAGDLPGLYTYRTTVDLTGCDPASVVLAVQVAVDDELGALRINGVGLGLTADGYSGFTPLTLTGPFQAGVNTLDFVINNAGHTANPSGLRVGFSFASPPRLAVASAWRAMPNERQVWKDTLSARMNQSTSLVAGLEAAVDRTEQHTLPRLRGSLVAAAACNTAIPSLYPTGKDFTVSFLIGLLDRQWSIVSLPSGTRPTTSAYISWPPNSAWDSSGTGSAWISPSQNETTALDAPGNYIYVTNFDLSLFDPGSVQLKMQVWVDDSITDVSLNGQSQGLTATGFANPKTLTLTHGFQQGINSLAISVNNAGTTGNPSGLRVQFSSTAPVAVPPDWVAQSLLIDVEDARPQKTTRMMEATGMMQGLFFGLRNGLFQGLSPMSAPSSWLMSPYESLAAFDDEWNWMGSYNNWQSIMRVFLYPENLLMPSFRLEAAAASGEPGMIAEKTAAFDGLTATLDSLAPLTPTAALDAVNPTPNSPATPYVTLLGQEITTLNAPPYNAGLPADLKSLKYPDPGTIDVTLNPWGPGLADWSIPAAIPFLWEVGYFVPVHIALELQKAGQFEAALEWFRLVYAYELPLIDGSDNHRKIFYGLQTENTQSLYTQIPTWMIDSANPHQIAGTRAYPYTRFTIFSIVQCLLAYADAQFGTETADSIASARTLYQQALDLLDDLDETLPSDPVAESNPMLAALRQHGETTLFNLRTGRNIAGVLIPARTSSDSAVSIQPSAYRYSALIDRARQLAGLAQQVEASYLASLEKADNEAYTALKANQDLETAGATVTLQQLQLQTATDGIALANDQVDKANNAVDHYNSLINSDIVSLERTSIDMQWAAVGLQSAAGAFYQSSAGVSSFNPGSWAQFGADIGRDVAASLQAAAGAVSTAAAIQQASASLEEKQSDWQFGLNQGQADVTVGRQQVTIAFDQQKTAVQQLSIATLQADHAKATVNFLANKFTNADLYRWMSGVLGSVYAYFLRQAAGMARIAESQLAFERQQKALSVIRPDYWQPLASGSGGSQAPGRAGLTGAETLLEDITTLDQYAFATDRIKLQITKPISLAISDPFAFQQFTETGVLRFATPMDLFDRDFPGHYLRLISQVRVSVIALIPPALGINATLANSGISRVIVQNDSSGFEAVTVRRDPQLIALSSPNNSTGLFPLTTSSTPALLLPFEDLGVDTAWEFTMPKAANPFDYSTIADVQVSIDYTALDSADYRLQLTRRGNTTVGADRAYSFRQQFPDAWYELNNASLSVTPFRVQFQSQKSDFPPNLANLRIVQLLIYFVPADGASFQLVPTLQFTPSGTATPLGGAAAAPTNPTAPPAYVFSTRRGNASGWVPILGQNIAGNWTFILDNTPATAAIFQNMQVQDILFVITYEADTLAWPS